jgi:plastocyanin
VNSTSLGGPAPSVVAQSAKLGAIKGTFARAENRLATRSSEWEWIRVRVAERRETPVQEIVVATADGSLANVFVSLQGTFPASPVPPEPVKVEQRACVYVPRVIGARVGQTLQVRNDDEVLHNVHSVSDHGNDFNLSQPKAGTGTSALH